MQESFALKAKRAVKRVAAVGVGVGMLGATMTGALALDLSEYPAPFVTDGTYNPSNVLVVGYKAAASDTLGMVDIATGLQFESKVCVSGGSVTVSGGITEDIPLGDPIADANTTTFDRELEDDDIDTLLDGEVTFQSSNYDIREVLVLGQDGKYSSIMTSLTSSEDDYQTDVVLETEIDSIKYYYVFDETIQPNASTTSNPLEIKFLGKTLKITDIATSVSNKFTAYVGTEYFMDVGDSVEVEGKKVTLQNVGEGGSIVVDVDGVVETISSIAETVNGIEIKVDETFYETVKAQRSATLIIGKDAQETYKDGDAYVGEDDDDPNWVWNIDNLNDNTATTTNLNGEFSGPYIGIENDFVWNDDSDNPVGVGECIDLPNNYISICLDSLTVADSDYKTYTFEFDSSADLSEAHAGSNTDVDAIYIHTNQAEGLIVDVSEIDQNGSWSGDQRTDKIWLFRNETDDAANDGLGVYFEDTNGKTQLAGVLKGSNSSFNAVDINYDNSKGDNLPMFIRPFNSCGTAGKMNITLTPYDSADLSLYNDNITMEWTYSSGYDFDSLGDTASSEEADELIWLGSGGSPTETTIGTKDEDHRTRYGIIIRDPKGHGSSDEVVLEIPSDQVQANVVIKGSAAITSSSGEQCTVAEITPVTKLDSEVAGKESMYNLILVGGPCASDAVEAVPGLGITCAGWTLKPGEGIIKLAANGDKVAMLVAGTNALDTRRAAKVVANYKDYALAGTEAMVKGTSLTDITVE